MMQTNPTRFNRRIYFEEHQMIPVRPKNTKLNQQSGKKKLLMMCISTMPPANDISKQQLRMNYLHGVIQGQIKPPNFSSQSFTLNSLNPLNQSLPFSQQSQSPVPPINFRPNPLQQSTLQVPSLNHSNIPSLNLANPFQNKSSLTNNYNFNSSNNNSFNSFGNQSNQKQIFANNNTQPILFANTPIQSTMFPNTNTQPTMFANTSQPTTNLLVQASTNVISGSPAFGNNNLGIDQATKRKAPFQNISNTIPFVQGTFGQGIQQNQPLSTVQPQLQCPPVQPNQVNQPQLEVAFCLPSSSNRTPLMNQPASTSGVQPQPRPPKPSIQDNISQLLQKKPNLWNILSLDPNFYNGFNQYGRLYIQSVMQKIVKEGILTEDALNKVILEIYKLQYGPENFQKLLHKNPKAFNTTQFYHQYREFRSNQLLAQQKQKKSIQSLFPADQIPDDFYRQRRRPAESCFQPIRKREENDYIRPQRRFFEVKRPQNVQLKIKFIDAVETQQSRLGQSGQQRGNQSWQRCNLPVIRSSISKLQQQHRKSLLISASDLPILSTFLICPSIQILSNYTKYQLLSVPKVIIQNQYGMIRFKSPISLYRKDIGQAIQIAKDQFFIRDQEWGSKDFEVVFNHYIQWRDCQLHQILDIEQLIRQEWKQRGYQVVSINKQTGQLVLTK